MQTSKIDIKAVALGFLADTVATMALAALLVTGLASAGITESDIQDRLKSPSGLLLSLIIGLGCTVLGGYVAGRTAKREELRHGTLVAAAGLVLGLALRESGDPLWYELTAYLCIIPAGMLGGYLAAERRTRTREEH